jgi:transcriptional regulator with XRE-family HTH domain
MISEEIHKLLEESDLSMSEISRRSGLSRATLYDVKKRKFRLKPESLERLLTVLGVSNEQIVWLIEETAKERKKARALRPKHESDPRNSELFAWELADQARNLGFVCEMDVPYVDFIVETSQGPVPVVAKMKVIVPDRFFAPIMASKLVLKAEWTALVTPFPPSKHKYHSLFAHHDVKWFDAAGFLGTLGTLA